MLCEMVSQKKGMTMSSNVLGLKFMQRTKVRLEEEQEKLLRSYLKSGRSTSKDVSSNPSDHSDSASTSQKPKSDSPGIRPVIYEYRVDLLEDLVFGRMSFKGFNEEVEKLMEYFREESLNVNLEEGAIVDGSKDVDDEEMAAIMGRNALVRKRLRNNDANGNLQLFEIPSQSKKTKFQKPSD